MFYTGKQFPAEYYGNVFAAEHGSWNRTKRTGQKIIRGFVKDGVRSGPYEDFATGFVIDNDRVWGRPVGITQRKDNSLLFSDDGNGTICACLTLATILIDRSALTQADYNIEALTAEATVFSICSRPV